MNDDVIRTFMNTAIFDEIIPTLTLPAEELKEFAASVQDRFKNPFIDHALLSIALNSTSKWKARVLPSVKEYIEKFGKVPPCLTKSLAFLIGFYHCDTYANGAMTGKRGNESYSIQDDEAVLKFYAAHKNTPAEELIPAVLSNEDFWGEDLTKLPGFEAAVLAAYKAMQEKGAYEVMRTEA
jgi:tagaturonate reductase